MILVLPSRRLRRAAVRFAAAGAVFLLAACAASNPGHLLDDVNRLDTSAKGPRAQTNFAQQPAAPGQQPTDVRLFSQSAAAGDAGANAAVTSGASAVTADDGGYQINLQGAPLTDAAKSLFEDVLKAPYSIDPRAQGTITMSTGGPVSARQMVRIFEAALQMNDLQLIYDGNQYKIVPAAVTAEGSPGGGLDAAQGVGYGITAVPLMHVSADKMMSLLDGFAIRAGGVRASADGNLLLIRGSSQERASLAGVAAAIDTDEFAKDRAAIAFLKNADAQAVLDDLDTLARNGSGPAQVRFHALERVNGILAVARDSGGLTDAMNWVRRLDQESDEGDGVHVYQVQYARASKLADVLNRTFGQGGGSGSRGQAAASSDGAATDSSAQNGSSVGDGAAADPNAAPDAGVPVDSQQGSGGDAGSGTVMSAPSAKVMTGNSGNASAISGGGEGPVRITANDDDNTLVIRAPGYAYRKVMALLRSIDKPPVQVLINVMIAEVALNDTLRYGVQAYLNNNDNYGLVSAAKLPVATQIPGANVVIGSISNPKVVLDALSQVTTVKVVSSPSVVALENQQAVIKVGEQVPVTTQQVVTLQTSTPPVVNSIEYRDAGVVLKVTPRVSQTNLVTMSVAQELSAVAGENTGTVNLTPTLRQRAITSMVAVYDQQTVVLGGLIAGQENNDKQGLPILGKLPIIGDLTGRTSKTGSRTELVVFITPKVVRDQFDASAVTNELRAKLQGFAN